MELSLEDVKNLIRLQSTAEELLGSIRAWKGGSVEPLRAASRQLDAVVESVRRVLTAADPSLAEQFEDEVARIEHGFHGADAKAAAVLGWLKGLTTAGQLDAQIAANAEAYAQARLREERGVGFRAPTATDAPIQSGLGEPQRSS